MVESSVKIISVSFVRPFRMDYTYGTILKETHIDRDTVTREMRVQNVVDSFFYDRYLISREAIDVSL